MNTLHLKIVSPERVVHEGEATRVTLRTRSGEITILPNHAPLVSLLEPGELVVEMKDKYLEWFYVSGGVVQISPNSTVTVLADTSEHASEIDAERAEQAREKAEQAMAEYEGNEVEVEEFQKIVNSEMARLRAHQKYHQTLKN